MALTDRINVPIVGDERGLKAALNRSRGHTSDFARHAGADIAKVDGSLSQMAARARGSFAILGAALGGIGVAALAREAITLADAWKQANNQLSAANVPAEEQAAVMERLFDQSQRYGTALDAQVKLYAGLRRAASELTTEQEQLFKFSEGVAAGLKLQGDSAQSASGALLQLTQLIRGGKVQAEEYNSLLDGAPEILQAVANGMDRAGGSVGRLTRLVKDGDVTSKQFFDAFLAGSEELIARSARAATTFDQAFTKINNALTRYVGQTDEGLGASQRLIAGLEALADNFDQVADVTLKVASVIASALLGRAVAGMISQVPLAVSGIVALTGAMRAGALSATLFAGSLGPIGLVLGAAAAAAYLFMSSQDSAAAASDNHRLAVLNLDAALAVLDLSNGDAVRSTRQKIEADIDAAEAALEHAEAELLLAEAARESARATLESTGQVVRENLGENALSGLRASIAERASELSDLQERLKTLDGWIADPESRPRPTIPALPIIPDDDGKTKKPKDDAWEKATERLADQNRELGLQREALKHSAEWLDKARTEQELLNAAIAAGKDITPALVMEIDRLAGGYAAAAESTRQVTERQEAMVALQAEFKDIAFEGISGLITGASSLNDVLADTASKLADMVLQATLLGEGPLAAFLGGGSGGGITGAVFSIDFGGPK